MMQTSPKCCAAIKDWEKNEATNSVALEAYDDGFGNWTIGWGRVDGVQRGDRITLEVAERYFGEDVGRAERALAACVTRPLTQGEYDAVVMFLYNCGPHALKGSHLLAVINAGDEAKLDAAWLAWSNATDHRTGKKVVVKGLRRRRLAELQFWHDTVQDDREGAIATVPG